MLLGYNLQKYTSVTCSVPLTNAVSMSDRTPKRAATFFWVTGAQTTAKNVTFTINDLAPFVPKAGMVLGLIGIPVGTKVTVAGIKASDGSALALGGNSTTQRTATSWDGTVAVYWQFDDGLAAINGYKITIYNDVNGATGIAAGAQCGIGEASVCPAVWIDHEPGMVSGRTRMSRIQRTLSGAVNVVNRPIYRTLALRPTYGTNSDWRKSALPGGMDFEKLLTAVAADPYVLVFDTADPTDMQGAGLFGISTKLPNIVGLTGPYAQFEQFEFEEIVSGSAGSAASAPPITSDSTRFLRADGSWSNTLTGPITVTGITLTGLSGYVKAAGAGVATASATVPTTDLSGTLQNAQMPAFGGDIVTVAGSVTATVAKIRGANVAAVAPASGQVLAFDGTNWTPTNVGAGGGGLGLGTMAYQAANAVAITGGSIAVASLTSTGTLVVGSQAVINYGNYVGLRITQGGANGGVHFGATAGASPNAIISNNVGAIIASFNADQSVDFATADVRMPGTASFGATTRQMLNLYGTSYGIGVQASAAYVRVDGAGTGTQFAVYRGGVHSNTNGDAGAGGTFLMKLDNAGNLTIPGAISASNTTQSEYNAGTTTASTTLNFAANGNRQACTLGANTTFAFTAPGSLSTIVLRITNGGSAFTVTWPATVKWPSGVAPSLGGAGAVTLVTLYWTGTNYFGSAMGPMQ